MFKVQKDKFIFIIANVKPQKPQLVKNNCNLYGNGHFLQKTITYVRDSTSRLFLEIKSKVINWLQDIR